MLIETAPHRTSGVAGAPRQVKAAPAPSTWTFLTNHAHVLVCIARDPEVRLRDIAATVGITERAAQRIVLELEQAEFLTRKRIGRRNRYDVHPEQPLRHAMDASVTIGSLLSVLTDSASA